MIHGGLFFGSGNDIAALTEFIGASKEEALAAANKGVKGGMAPCLNALNNSVKPTVAVVRGFAIGISFTILSLVDFIYVTPEVSFSTPFMQSCQSPEGSATYSFP